MSKRFCNLPNYLTAFRIILIPVFIIVFYLPFSFSYVASAVVFALACATDWFDGYLARRLDLISPWGEFLDPVADKLVIATALVLLVGQEHLSFITIPAAIIIGREIVISALREWMAEIGKRTHVTVSMIGKWKTLIQMFAVFFLLLHRPEGSWITALLGYGSLYLAAILTLWSMTMYIQAAWPQLGITFHSKKEKTS